MALQVTINGRERTLDQLSDGSTLSQLLVAMDLKSDRVAMEVNGAICPRQTWNTVTLHDRDRLEIVHFVGGGA